MPRNGNASTQGRFWLLTIPQHCFIPYPVPGCEWIRGQLERGSNTGFLHWQVFVCCERKRRIRWIKDTFGVGIHAELSRSSSAEEYVWKEDTRVSNTQFEFGQKPLKRNSRADWERVWTLAKSGDFEEVMKWLK